MKNNLTAVIVAAGSASRFNNKVSKPFIKLAGYPVIWYSLYAFEKSYNVTDIFVVVSEKDTALAEAVRKKYFKKIKKFKSFIIGGKERHNSVYNALIFLSKNVSAGYVAVHDAARPFIMPELIDEVYNNAVKFDASAPALPVVDTIKIVDKNNFIKEHPFRENVFAIQTPQIFNYKKLLSAYQKTLKENRALTDDAEVYGKYFKKIKLVAGSCDLFKITYPKDFELAKNKIKKYKKLWK